MQHDQHAVTAAEWNVMEHLWNHAPCTGREVIDALSESAGWSRSTTLTMLRRMTQKGLIECAEHKGVNTYSPLVRRETATIRETVDFLDRVYHGSVSMMLSTFTKRQPLTPKEIEELYAILDEAKEANLHD